MANHAQPISINEETAADFSRTPTVFSPLSEDLNRPADSLHRMDERNPHLAAIQELAGAETLPASLLNSPSPRFDSDILLGTDEER